MTPWKITAVRPGTRLNERSMPVRTMVVSYTVGSWGPFELELDADKFTAQAAQQAVADAAAHLAALQSPG